VRGIGGKLVPLVLEELASVSGQNEDSREAGPRAGLDVVPAVADDIGTGQIDLELP
jgi:hypothetical protein